MSGTGNLDPEFGAALDGLKALRKRVDGLLDRVGDRTPDARRASAALDRVRGQLGEVDGNLAIGRALAHFDRCDRGRA